MTQFSLEIRVEVDIYETKSLHNYPAFALEDLKALHELRFPPVTLFPSMCLKVSSEQYSKPEYPLPVAGWLAVKDR